MGILMDRKEMEAAYGRVWNTKELQEQFSVEGFSFGFVIVKDKEGKRCTLDFQHMPRFYHSLQVHKE